MININKPFILYATAEVVYDGRAYSILERGNYLIIYKDDGSIQIHGGNKIQPRNYQGAKSTIKLDGNILTSSNKKETIIINIYKIINISYLDNWSCNEINIRKTEKELANKIFINWCDYIDGDFEIIEREYKTDVGDIDLIGWAADLTIHVVEVKRKKASLSDCTQLLRYIEAIGGNSIGYLASPEIGENALRYLNKHDLKWLYVDFDLN